MRNKFPGICYRCTKPVKKGEGHFERCDVKRGLLTMRGWRTIHATCVFEQRAEKAAARENNNHLAT